MSVRYILWRMKKKVWKIRTSSWAFCIAYNLISVHFLKLGSIKDMSFVNTQNKRRKENGLEWWKKVVHPYYVNSPRQQWSTHTIFLVIVKHIDTKLAHTLKLFTIIQRNLLYHYLFFIASSCIARWLITITICGVCVVLYDTFFILLLWQRWCECKRRRWPNNNGQ